MTDTHRATAIVPSGDLDKSKTFYELLGFQLISDYGDYRILADGHGWHLHLREAKGWPPRPEDNPFGLYLYTDRVDELAEHMRDAILGPEKAPTHKPWGIYEFALSDPDETLVRIGWPSALVT